MLHDLKEPAGARFVAAVYSGMWRREVWQVFTDFYKNLL